ncbi:hypothetical protein COOONC_08759, partial [Cooperia oncophora]
MSRESLRLRLVEMIETETSIWDINCDEYHLLGKKTAAWERILRKLQNESFNVSMSEIQGAWKSIKDARRKRKRLEATTGSPALKKWKYEELLTFLDRNDYDGSTISNIDINGNFCLTEQLPLEKEVEEERLKLGPKEEKSKKSKQDEALCMIKEAAAAVKAQVEKREAPSKEKSDDRIEFRDNKYWYF